MNLQSYNTPLVDRTLWYDGISSYDPTQIIKLIGKGIKVDWVNFFTPEILEYNIRAASSQQINTKTESNMLNLDWNIPIEYANLDVVAYVSDKHSNLIDNMDINDAMQREVRLANELIRYKNYNLIGVLRTIIYIINTLTVNNIIWGVGRGSSVASYVLYVIGAHDVDSYKYNLDINDFLHN